MLISHWQALVQMNLGLTTWSEQPGYLRLAKCRIAEGVHQSLDGGVWRRDYSDWSKYLWYEGYDGSLFLCTNSLLYSSSMSCTNNRARISDSCSSDR